MTSSGLSGEEMTIPLPAFAMSEQGITIETDKWAYSAKAMSCKPPCTMTLPPLSFAQPATLSYPPVSTTICKEVDGVVYTYSTTISIALDTVSEMSLQPVTLKPMSSGDPMATYHATPVYPGQRVSNGNACWRDVRQTGLSGERGWQVRKDSKTSCPSMQCCSPEGVW